MEEPKKSKLEEGNVNKFDFTKFELDYIKENANFTDEKLKIFNMLTGKRGRETTTYISMQINLSERTIERRIKHIKAKIIRLL